MKNISRRQSLSCLIKGSIAGATVAGSAWSSRVLAALESDATKTKFIYGVASGDPTHTSVVIWTKLNIESEKSERVRWVVSTNSSFTDIVRSGHFKAKQESDFGVKINVKRLKPGVRYYYKFIHAGVESEPGRTRTLPSGSLEKLGIAIASCSNYPFGFFNAYEAIANDENIDFVIHLGDYIYEYGHDGYGAETGKKLGREHIPAHETVSLCDYRLRHAQYKSDVSSRLMHATHPLIPIWDDHESTNNPYMTGAQNHQEDEGNWSQRRKDSLQAYFEWMPVRDAKRGETMEEYWRSFEFGDLATLVTLETRHTGRSKQIDYGEHLENINSKEERDTFVTNILGDRSRTILSEDMTEFLKEKLSHSVEANTAWRMIGNQIPMARTHVPKISDDLIAKLNIGETSPVYNEVMRFKKLGDLDLPIYTDTWDGYPVARENFYKVCKDAGAQDLIVLTGDSHAYWLNQLADSDGEPMGYEVGTSGVTSPGDFEYFGKETASMLDQLMVDANDEILWTDNVSKGYVRLAFSKPKVTIDYVAVSDILTTKYTTKVIKSVSVTHSLDSNTLVANKS